MIRRGHGALGPVLLLLAQQAAAVALGDIEVRSALGEPLEARIPLTLNQGEAVDASCFTLSRARGNEAMPQLAEGTLTVDAAGAPAVLRVRSAARLFEPAMALRIRAACPGETEPVERQYVLLLDPRPGTAGVEALPVVGATVNARPGDSLRSLAATMFPNERAPRAQYLAALREMNPHLAARPGEVLPDGTAVALPDLRDFSRARPKRMGATRPAAAPPAEATPRVATPRAPRQQPAERAAPPSTAAMPPPSSSAATPSPSPASAITRAKEVPAANAPRAPAKAAAPTAPGSAFVLKLSSSEVDMSRTRGIDDRKRALLRERQLVLDSDDQVAALLALRNSMKQLESRVADLQLKLAAMPASLARSEPAASVPPPHKAPPPVAARPEPPRPLPPAVQTAKIELAKAAEPKPAPAMTAAPKIEQAKVEPAKAQTPPKVEAPKAAPPPPAPVVAAPVVAAPAVAPVQTSPLPPKGMEEFDWKDLAAGPWLWAALLALAAIVLGLIAWRRRARDRTDEAIEPDVDEVKMAAERAVDEEAKLIAPRDLRTDRPEMASDAGLSTRLPANSRELRRRYIEERFPEIANRTLALEDPKSIVKGARLFYEDGALPRAVELLQFAIDDKPAEVRTWLALFEIFRLERLTGEFAELARRFHEQHGNSEHWRKVQYFGREIDPANPLYKEDAINTLETIGPREAKRVAAAGAAVDPIAENWLDAPMDFENEVLANELRQSLMTVAGLTEQDLIPNPMPALRNVEMFTVA